MATLAVALLSPVGSRAATFSDAWIGTVKALEASQARDGSWGVDPQRSVVTAEALLALAKAGQGGSAAAQRAEAWLLNTEVEGVDFRARALRALAVAGLPMTEGAQALDAEGAAGLGWGPTSGEGVTSYDSALAMAAIRAAQQAVTGESAKLAEVLARRRADGGWSGDGVAETTQVGTQSRSDRTLTAEVVRALSEVTDAATLQTSWQYLSSNAGVGGAAVDAQTPTLELAARAAALHALGIADSAIESELLSRVPAGGSFDASDPFTNALGLLALATDPTTAFSPTDPNDYDQDGFVNAQDAFPFDASEHLDTDGDGLGDNVDPDRDGDGWCDPGVVSDPSCVGTDLFASDPTEHADANGDGIGDNTGNDADGDGVLDADELLAGTNPLSFDTDGDGIPDAVDPCPLGGVDQDGDGVCTPLDECDAPGVNTNPLDIQDFEHDGVCDLADTDDDNDGVLDVDELAYGSDPRNASSVPTLDPNGDFDRDGLSNSTEQTVGTSPYRADTDSDGFTDRTEFQLGTSPWDPTSVPGSPIRVFSAMSTADQPLSGDGASALRGSLTGGQATPVAVAGGADSAGIGGGLVNRPGFQPQTTMARDLDGDGLDGFAENARNTSNTNVDSDGDGFTDGPGGLVDLAKVAGGWDLDGDGKADGEGDPQTDPADPGDHPGRAGDVAPLGHPDGKIAAADGSVSLRLAADPTLTNTLSGQNKTIADRAADANCNGSVTAADAVVVLRELSTGTPVPDCPASP